MKKCKFQFRICSQKFTQCFKTSDLRRWMTLTTTRTTMTSAATEQMTMMMIIHRTWNKRGRNSTRNNLKLPVPSCNRPSVLSYLDVGGRLASNWWRLREQSSIIKHQAERFKLVVDDVITRFLQTDAVDAHLYTSDVLPEHNWERNNACKHVNIEK